MLDQYKLQTVKLVQKKYNDVGACYKEGALHVEKKVKRAIKFSTGLCIVSLYGTLFAHYLRGYPQMTSCWKEWNPVSDRVRITRKIWLGQ